MRAHERLEEEPEEEPDESPTVTGSLPGPMVPTAISSGDRHFEFRTELLTEAQVTDGKTLPERLTAASEENWDLIDVISLKSGHVLLLRRPKKVGRESRPVGFTTRGN